MNEHDLRRKIEREIAENLRHQGFSVEGTYAFLGVADDADDDDDLGYIGIDIADLAEHLVREGLVK